MAKLHFLYSTMNAGKSTNLLQASHNYRERGMTTLLLTARLDDRAGPGRIASRIGIAEPAETYGTGDDLRALIEARLAAAEEKVAPQRDAACCYAQGNKSWSRDPAGVPWETFHTMADIQYFGSDHQPLDDVEKPAPGGACCG